MATSLKKAKDFLLDLFFPKFCLLCAGGSDWVCELCAKKLVVKPAKTCSFCLSSPTTPACTPCREAHSLSALTYAFPYENESVQTLIHALKYQGITDVSDFLSQKLFETVGFYPFRKSWIVVPVPLHWQRKNERGYNQAELLAEGLAKRLKLEAHEKSLARTRYTKSQINFDKIQRQENLKGVFAVQDETNIKDKNILLVDDVATTLSTLDACAAELKRHGARNVWGVVIARALE